jgi:hypothetical protein
MAVHVVGGSLMTSDQTEHRARSVGDGGWVVSYPPGRTLAMDQAVAAMQVAEIVAAVGALAGRVGLTALEAVGMVLRSPPWPAERTSRCRLRPDSQRPAGLGPNNFDTHCPDSGRSW